MYYHFTPVRMASVNINTHTPSASEDVKHLEPCMMLVGMQNGAATMETAWKLLKKLKNKITM
jgi:hypothetical protein